MLQILYKYFISVMYLNHHYNPMNNYPPFTGKEIESLIKIIGFPKPHK